MKPAVSVVQNSGRKTGCCVSPSAQWQTATQAGLCDQCGALRQSAAAGVQ